MVVSYTIVQILFAKGIFVLLCLEWHELKRGRCFEPDGLWYMSIAIKLFDFKSKYPEMKALHCYIPLQIECRILYYSVLT